MPKTDIPQFEPITFAMIGGCYCLLAVAVTWLPDISAVLAFCVATIAIALHSSLQHEVLHGHPTRIRVFNELLVFPSVGLMIPYGRFRDLHLAHHHDEILTDPYDDPETNYLDPAVWVSLPGWKRMVLRLNNTLAGRIVLGPLVSEIVLIRGDIAAIRKGEPGVLWAWILHAPGVLLVLWLLITYGTMPLWLYLLAAYFGFGLLKIRTYLEHRANTNPKARTVIIEDNGPLALLFLNNNLHVVHHTHPGIPWYRLPAKYRANRDEYLRQNDGYFFRNYGEIFRKFLFRAKDPVPHPLWK